jgi:threonine aldolase
VQTNIVVLDTAAAPATAVVAAARDRGVLLSAVGPRTVRAVTHLDVSLDDCVTAGRIVGELLGTP